MEKKVTTYGDLKCRKAEFRNDAENGDFGNLEEYRQTTQAIKDAELMLLYSITPDESCGALPEQVSRKARKRVKYVVIAIGIVVWLSVVLSGCRSTIRGTGQVLQGIGQGTGTIVTGVGNYLVEEGQE